ncbi:MAG TPA: LysR substrate-binding domain-containing protein [Acidimicrobiia bacterium]|nr:LysR substrate-binding domain-containing protein [Acidimicrobiia bacterium]HEV3451159.1 LysR substrate-binding domain-containing protein [Acidimicrobiia bacterium]
MELRHLDTVLAIAEQGSFTAAADALATVQSNVSEQVRQLEAELGAQLLTRGRRGATPTECGERVIDRARRVRRELEALRADLSMLQGLEAGHASFGTVGTASRWIVPRLVTELRARAPGVRLRVNEGASERLVTEVLAGELAQAVVTEPVHERRLVAETLLEEALVGVVPVDAPLPSGPVLLDALATYGLVLPPRVNPLRDEVEHAAAARGLTLPVTVEVEGIRLIADLVAAGAGASVLPETAVPTELIGVRTVPLADVPPRRLALVSARDSALSLADRAVRDCVRGLVAASPVHIRSMVVGAPPLVGTAR